MICKTDKVKLQRKLLFKFDKIYVADFSSSFTTIVLVLLNNEGLNWVPLKSVISKILAKKSVISKI